MTGTPPDIAAMVEAAAEKLKDADWSRPEFDVVRRKAEDMKIGLDLAAKMLIRDQIMAYRGMEPFPTGNDDMLDALGYAMTLQPTDPQEDPVPPEDEELVIPEPGEAYWWDDPAQAAFTDHYIATRHALGASFDGGLMVVGPSGSGKTGGIVRAVARLGLRLTKMDCATVTDPQKWFGRREVDETGTHFIRSDFTDAVERGDVVLFDDITRLHPHLHNPIMALLDGSNAVNISDLNLTITRHPQTVFIATANIGPQFSGTHRLDWAMRSRFPYTLERPWPPRDDEIRILVTATGCDDDGAANLVDIAIRSRQMYEAGDLRVGIDTRTLVAAAFAVAMGKNETNALELTAVHLYDPDASGIAGAESDRTRIRAVISQKLGQR